MDIITERLRLRLMQPEDAEWIAREISNPSVQRWLTSPPHPYSLTDAHSFIAAKASDPGLRVIEHNGIGCGMIEITPATDTCLGLGYWLRETAWGQGLMSEAARAMIDWIYETTTSDIRSGWIIGNAGSRNVLTKLGFQPDGQRQEYANFHGKDLILEQVRMTHAAWQLVKTTR